MVGALLFRALFAGFYRRLRLDAGWVFMSEV